MKWTMKYPYLMRKNKHGKKNKKQKTKCKNKLKQKNRKPLDTHKMLSIVSSIAFVALKY